MSSLLGSPSSEAGDIHMKSNSHDLVKEHYRRLRDMSCEALWTYEVPLFDAAAVRERVHKVSVVRAVGVVFSEKGTAPQKQMAREWLRGLLSDPSEKIRRYAMVALPKLGADESDEKQLLDLAVGALGEREKRFVMQSLERIGGSETLKAGQSEGAGEWARVVQKVRANVARKGEPGTVTLDRCLDRLAGVLVFLECRSGLESLLLEELSQCAELQGVFEVVHSGPGWIELRPLKAFSLGQLYTLRCFSAAGFVIGKLPPLPSPGAPVDARKLAGFISGSAARAVFEGFTKGAVRYRLEFESRKASEALVRQVTEHVFQDCPSLLNDSRAALWQVRVWESARGISVELTPRLRPDPRFAYRQGDVPAASHPPLAAAMARIAGVGVQFSERIWDPFCGSGLELAECVRLGSVEAVFGTDVSASAVSIAEANVKAAALENRVRLVFAHCDFRNAGAVGGLRDLSLMITNPPLGKRVPVRDLQAMVHGLFDAALRLLRPGGRLVFVNPLERGSCPAGLRLVSKSRVDVGFAHFHIEKYVRQESRSRS